LLKLAQWKKVSDEKIMKTMGAAHRIRQAEINEEVVAIMDHAELRDMHRFGKARIAREKDLRDPDDVFIHAEERKRELLKKK
jgi:hypothetical protein